MEKSFPRLKPGSWLQRGLRFGKPNTFSTRLGAKRSFRPDHFGTRGVSAVLLAMTLAMLSTVLANSAMTKVCAPRQCEITCSGTSPVSRRTSSTAGG